MIADGHILCFDCQQNLVKEQLEEQQKSGMKIGIGFIVFVVILLIFIVSSWKPETTADRPDFRPWFDKPKSEWTEKDNREYLEFHIKRMNEKAENEKAFK